jgi:predicted 3-demethylubiquinone-9 3-methyltransferase (glyoxalase superfamily)
MILDFLKKLIKKLKRHERENEQLVWLQCKCGVSHQVPLGTLKVVCLHCAEPIYSCWVEGDKIIKDWHVMNKPRWSLEED